MSAAGEKEMCPAEMQVSEAGGAIKKQQKASKVCTSDHSKADSCWCLDRRREKEYLSKEIIKKVEAE